MPRRTRKPPHAHSSKAKQACQVCGKPGGLFDKTGRCRDRAACEKRQPPLFAVSDIPTGKRRSGGGMR